MMNTLFLSSAAVLAIAQAGGESATSLYAEEPKSWTLEYPVAITPFVDDYYNCLKSGMRFVKTDQPLFEEQHRSDVPRCAEVESTAIAEANASLARRGTELEATPEQVAGIFATVRQIHIERGRDLDDHIRLRTEARNEYWVEHRDTERQRKVTVVDLEVVTSRPKEVPSQEVVTVPEITDGADDAGN